MMQIADRVQRIAASQSLAMAARAKAMKAAGIDVISMSLGEPDMDTPEHIRRAAQEAKTTIGLITGLWRAYRACAKRLLPRRMRKKRGLADQRLED